MSEILQISIKRTEKDTCELFVSGQMEASGAEVFKSACSDCLQKEARHLIIDLSKVTVISSSGIGALMVLQEDCQDRGGRADYVALSREVQAVVRLLDLESILNIDQNKTGAMQGNQP